MKAASVASGQRSIEWFGALSLFTGHTLRECFRRPFEFSQILKHVFEMGCRSASLVAVAGFALGAVLALQTRSTLTGLGAAGALPMAVAFAMVKEIGPLVTGLLVAGRVGAGIGAELAGMRVTEQIDALESLAVNSFKYLVVPRVVACAIVLPMLTVLADFAGIAGGFVASYVATGMTFRLYFAQSFSNMSFSDYIPPTLKTIVFGLLIGSVSGYLGYNATGGSEGVGSASTQSVVISSLFIIVVDVVMVKFISLLVPLVSG